MGNNNSFGNSDYTVSVVKCKVSVTDSRGKRQMPDEVALILQKDGKDVEAGKRPIFIQMTKDEAKEMALQLLKLASKTVSAHELVLNESLSKN